MTSCMRLDAQSARDLEIFQGQGGAAGLFDSLDRTRTQGGREALRARFRKPLASVAEIAAVQGSLRFIMERAGLFEGLPGDTALAGLQRYLRSNLVFGAALVGPAAAVEALWTRLFYRDLFREAAAGVALTAGVLRALASFLAAPALSAAPGELGALLEEMRQLLASRELRSAVARVAWPEVLHLDAVIRGDARASIERLLRLAWELDALRSMAAVTGEKGFRFPEVVDGPSHVLAQGVYHPFLTTPVPNDLRLDDTRRVLFLTGPNMAGKTTYLRACGIAVYLAQLGMGVPAAHMRLSPFDTLLSAIGLSDDVREGISFFRAEALRMKDVARALSQGERVFGLFDEPFKGTNVRDALDASRAVLLRLARAQGSVFLVSSHLIELADALAALPTVAAERFEAQEGADELRYDYVARPGVSSQRLGMRVLEEEGVFALFDEMPTAVPEGRL